MKKKISAILFTLTILGASSITSNNIYASEVSNFSDTDTINSYRISSSGYIYTPVALTAQALFNWDYSSTNVVQINRQDLIASALSQYWSSFPNGNMSVGTMKLRGTTQSLPNVGSYIYNPSYSQTGRYNNGSSGTWYTPDSSASSGNVVYNTGSGGYQLNTTAQVDFNW